MQNQSSQWLNVRRDKPDYMVIWGWGAMNPTAVKEAAKIRYPMDKFIGVWWSGGDDDVRPAGAGAVGYKTLNINGVGAQFPAIQDIKAHVVDKGLSKTDPGKVGENLYNRGVLNSVLMAEAIRTAQKMTGKAEVNAEEVRAGMENLDLSAERLKEIGLEGFATPIKLSCAQHSGHHNVYVQQWDGETWKPVTDWFSPMTDVVEPLLEAAAKDYVSKNQPWPARAEPCS
jgi:branched-chain amino acid transport system substrate-binding protein